MSCKTELSKINLVLSCLGKSALMQTRLNSTRLSEKPWLAFMKKKRLSLGQRQVSLQFHHLVGSYCPKKLKIECHQKAKLREKQFAYFHDSCSRCHFDSPSQDSSCAISYLAPRIIFQPGLNRNKISARLERLKFAT